MRSVSASVIGMAVATALVSGAPAFAATLYDSGTPTLGPSSGAGLDKTQYFAGSLGFTESVTVTGIESYLSGFGTLTFSIYERGDSDLPGIKVFSQRGTIGADFENPSWAGVHGLSVNLDPGTYYFALEVLPDDTLAFGTLFLGTKEGLDWAIHRENFGWAPISPGNWPLRVYGEGGGDVTGFVPEPDTWALMILGFGAAGCCLRRRKAASRMAHGTA